MVDYVIGDVQGCFTGLQKLLKKINYNKNDKLLFLGDVVNRGSQSLEVLKFIQENNHKIVLGNHDFYLLACYFGIKTANKKDTFTDILTDKKVNDYIEFLINQDIVISENNNFYVHAGIPPIFNKTQIIDFNKTLTNLLQKNPKKFITNTFGNQEKFNGVADNQYLINAFMRMRFCTSNGEMEFNHKQNYDKNPAGFKAWFLHPEHKLKKYNIYFGHWSTLKTININNIYPLDNGYIWGGSLSCIRLNDNTIFSIK